MKIVVGVATFNEREPYFLRAVDSIENQTVKPDEVIVYHNGLEEVDKTDNGKFYGLSLLDEPVYYFSIDDDIIYPNWYIEETIKKIEEHKAIVTYHGRKLLGTGLNYYKGHQGYRVLGDVDYEGDIDIAGTGCTAFRTDYFNPTEIHNSNFMRMSDCVFSLEAAKQGKRIVMLPHKKGDFKDLHAPVESSCWGREHRGAVKQMQHADLIYKLKYETY